MDSSNNTKSDNNSIMPFGKWAGTKFGNVPKSYLRWFINQDWCNAYPDLVVYANLVLDEKMKYVITVDPGCFTMGVCLWNKSEFDSDKDLAFPKNAMCIDYTVTERNDLGQMQAMQQNLDMIDEWFDIWSVDDCYCEKPSVFQSARGFTTSVQGHLQNMDMFRGMLFLLCKNNKCEFHDVEVLKWKGQLPKSLTNERIRMILGKQCKVLSKKESHDWDACGIGLFMQGEFK